MRGTRSEVSTPRDATVPPCKHGRRPIECRVRESCWYLAWHIWLERYSGDLKEAPDFWNEGRSSEVERRARDGLIGVP